MSPTAIRQAPHYYRQFGIGGLLGAVGQRLRPRPIAALRLYLDRLRGARALEIGGPSQVFGDQGCLPVYRHLATVDGCNFSSETLWTGAAQEGPNYLYHPDRPPGIFRVREAVELSGIADGEYQCLLSSHVLEHVANPVRALLEWKRVLRTGAAMILVLPHYQATFDHRRQVTTLSHLLDDFRKSTAEDDRTHLEEFADRIDLGIAPGVSSRDDFLRRTLAVAELRAVHHHVFDAPLAVELVDHAGFEVHSVDLAWPWHLMLLASKPDPGAPLDNQDMLERSRRLRFGRLHSTTGDAR